MLTDIPSGMAPIVRQIDEALQTVRPYSTSAPPSFILGQKLENFTRRQFLNDVSKALNAHGFRNSSYDRPYEDFSLANSDLFFSDIDRVPHPKANILHTVIGITIQKCRGFLESPDRRNTLEQLKNLSESSCLIFFYDHSTENRYKRETIKLLEQNTRAKLLNQKNGDNRLPPVIFDPETLAQIGLVIWNDIMYRDVDVTEEFMERFKAIVATMKKPEDVKFFLEDLDAKVHPTVLTAEHLNYMIPELKEVSPHV